MSYYPKREEQSYHCPNCNQWYIPGYINCLVNHPEGSCCHVYDTLTSALTPESMKVIDKEIRRLEGITSKNVAKEKP